jgi:hypothetical protein
MGHMDRLTLARVRQASKTCALAMSSIRPPRLRYYASPEWVKRNCPRGLTPADGSLPPYNSRWTEHRRWMEVWRHRSTEAAAFLDFDREVRQAKDDEAAWREAQTHAWATTQQRAGSFRITTSDAMPQTIRSCPDATGQACALACDQRNAQGMQSAMRRAAQRIALQVTGVGQSLAVSGEPHEYSDEVMERGGGSDQPCEIDLPQ